MATWRVQALRCAVGCVDRRTAGSLVHFRAGSRQMAVAYQPGSVTFNTSDLKGGAQGTAEGA